MYVPAHFEEKRPEVLRELIARNPLGTLVMLGQDGLVANHLPLEHILEPKPNGTLRGHVARANPVWREASAQIEGLVIFRGPAAYVSPSLYPSKQETGKVVPTWDYAVVHAYGPVKFIHDTDWLHALVNGLTDYHETDQAKPWKVSDAPGSYTQAMLKAIVGIEIPVVKFIGKWKVSQNHQQHDRDGVIHGFRESGEREKIAIADMMADRQRS